MLHSFGEGWSPVLDFSMIILELEMLVKTKTRTCERSALDILDMFHDRVRKAKNYTENQ